MRRTTFCPSELPSTAQSFDDYFSVCRPHLSQEVFIWTVKRTRACSVGGVNGKPNFEESVEMASGLDQCVEAHVQTHGQTQSQTHGHGHGHELAGAQIDGPSGRRKLKKVEKARRKKVARSMKHEGGGVEDVDEPVQGKDGCGREVFVVDGDGRGQKNEEEEEQRYVEQVEDVGEDRDVGLQEEEAVEEPLEDELACRIHRRLMCQFNTSCCVHRPAQETGCGCPPRHSCCCMHHVGDCCTCRNKASVTDGDDDMSETLSAAAFTLATPTTNPISADIAAPATASATASPSTPPNPANVKVMVTSASPCAMKGIGPVGIDGVEDTRIVSAQASLELSNALIEMMDLGIMSDFRLTLRSMTDRFLPIHLTAHRCILARSPHVSSLLLNPHYSHELVALAGEHFSMVKPWEQVVHYLYGRPMLTPQTLKPVTLEGLGYDPFPERVCELEYPFSVQAAMLDMALGYAVCGAFFHLPTVVVTGFSLALDLISWETVEHMLSFGLCTYKFAVILPTPSWAKLQPLGLRQDARQDAHAGTAEAPEADTFGQEKQIAPEVSINAGETITDKTVPVPVPPPADMPSDASHLHPIYLLESYWSQRTTTAALNFLLDHITLGFRVYCDAKSDLVPDRIPDYLRAPFRFSKKTIEKPAEGHETPMRNKTLASITSSFAVANNPRLAEVKFGFFPTSDGEGESSSDEQPRPKSKSQKKREKQKEKKKHQEEQGRAVAAPEQNIATPGPEVTITSAVLLSIDYYHLQLIFSMLSERHVLTSSLASSIITEREARRYVALKHYAEMIHANTPSVSANAGLNADATSGGDAGAGSKRKVKGKRGQEKDNANASRVHLPDEMRELCYREFLASKAKIGPKAAGQDEAEVEIVLQREWVGIEH
ncbi:hypothetical protein BJX63DRAFT_430879 [Aspergillus granulosus]|uniref:BTB domain-containing protein n=1 Tax=Aspergillus granulosus TaxID=176169 RepID=A0ABR4HIR9_9EURO